MVWSVLGAPLVKLGWEMKVMEQEANVTNKFWSWVIRKNNVWLFQWVICKEQWNRIFKKLLHNCLFTEKKSLPWISTNCSTTLHKVLPKYSTTYLMNKIMIEIRHYQYQWLGKQDQESDQSYGAILQFFSCNTKWNVCMYCMCWWVSNKQTDRTNGQINGVPGWWCTEILWTRTADWWGL